MQRIAAHVRESGRSALQQDVKDEADADAAKVPFFIGVW